MNNEEAIKSPNEAGNSSHKEGSGAGDNKVRKPTPADRCMRILTIGCPVVFGGIIIVSCYLFFKNSAFDSLGLFGLIIAGCLALIPFVLCVWKPSFLLSSFLAYQWLKYNQQESPKGDDTADFVIDKVEEAKAVGEKMAKDLLSPPHL